MTRTAPQPSDGPDDPNWSPAERPALVLSRATARMTRTAPQLSPAGGPDGRRVRPPATAGQPAAAGHRSAAVHEPVAM